MKVPCRWRADSIGGIAFKADNAARPEGVTW